MRKKITIGVASGLVVLVAHYFYGLYRHQVLESFWTNIGQEDFLSSYLRTHDIFLGLSYALSTGFFTYALVAYRENRRSGVKALVGSATLSGALYAGACFFLGCCGSPMLGVYLALFGAPFLGLTKVATFAVTLVSVALGMRWLDRRLNAAQACCDDNSKCESSVC